MHVKERLRLPRDCRFVNGDVIGITAVAVRITHREDFLAFFESRDTGADFLHDTRHVPAGNQRKLGADETIDYTKEEFEDVAHKIDIVLDTLGGEMQERSWPVLNKGGVLISLVEPPSEQQANQFGVRGIMCSVQPNGAQLNKIAKLLDSSKLRPTIDRILPLSEARRAHELSQNGHVHGKILLRVKDIQL
jgi:D-arabinose 1-dehydrogenase-like Zn-dependent alcohol dehydrogenase